MKVLVNDKVNAVLGAETSKSLLTKKSLWKNIKMYLRAQAVSVKAIILISKPDVKPVVHPPLKVPVALSEPLKKELEKLVTEKILAPVSEPTDWLSSMVI